MSEPTVPSAAESTHTYRYEWALGGLLNEQLLTAMATLYSSHYGIWSQQHPTFPGRPVKLSVKRIREYTGHEKTTVAYAYFGDELVGYAIILQLEVERRGIVSWVTQFVVHADHRKRGVGKQLLFSAWTMSDHYAWGLLTSNPYAIRALEFATQRRCAPSEIKKFFPALLEHCRVGVPYAPPESSLLLNSKTAQADTNFDLDHSAVQSMITHVSNETKPWVLGNLQSKWEWVAFTFQSQPQAILNTDQLDEMLRASDRVAMTAYKRMCLSTPQNWAKKPTAECDFILNLFKLPSNAKILDFGCGAGRHVTALMAAGYDCTGVDFVDHRAPGTNDFPFVLSDCREVDLPDLYDAGLCLYDVVGSHVCEDDNLKILRNLHRLLRPGAPVLLSVMSLSYTIKYAKYTFRLEESPNALFGLKPSRTMETSGDVFDPNYYMVDTTSNIVYRKEQFKQGRDLPQELLVRDRRYTPEMISDLCRTAGFNVEWARGVRAGRWGVDMGDEGKEILVFCRAV
jgi:SAM-dependent methyltransferase